MASDAAAAAPVLRKRRREIVRERDMGPSFRTDILGHYITISRKNTERRQSKRMHGRVLFVPHERRPPRGAGSPEKPLSGEEGPVRSFLTRFAPPAGLLPG